MGKQYLIDTNILIYYLNNDIPFDKVERLESIFESSFQISTISKIEILGWKAITAKEIEKVSNFLQFAKVIYIDSEIERIAIKTKQEKKVKTPDAIIAATAVSNNFTLITRNEDDFKNIPDMVIWNPFS